MTTGAREGYAFTVSCKTSAVFIMQTCKCLAVIEENKLDVTCHKDGECNDILIFCFPLCHLSHVGNGILLFALFL